VDESCPPGATITLTAKEREELEALAHARKSEAPIVLLAVDGRSSRAIGAYGALHAQHGREVPCPLIL